MPAVTIHGRLILLLIEVVPEYLWILHNLIQEICIREDSLVHFVEFFFIPNSSQNLLVLERKSVDIAPSSVVRRELFCVGLNQTSSSSFLLANMSYGILGVVAECGDYILEVDPLCHILSVRLALLGLGRELPSSASSTSS